MANLDPQQLMDILQQLRECRAIILGDAEAFQKAALGLEHIAELAGAPVGVGLAKGQQSLFRVLANEDEELRNNARSLFEVVREARNMAVHDGAWVRQRSVQLLDLLLILEEATIHQLKTVEQLMVSSVAIAERWHSLARVRRTMLSHSFSFLPIHLDGWKLLSDEAIVAITRTVSIGERNRRLGASVERAVTELELTVTEAETVGPQELISRLVGSSHRWPLLVTNDGAVDKSLLGILTPFDLL